MRTVPGLLLGALTLVAEPADLATAESAVQVLELRIADGMPIAANVYVNAEGPFKFLIDTGSQLNSISEKVAARRNWQPAFAMELVSLQGVALRGGFVASRVELGSLAVEGQKFLIAPREEMARVGRGVDGVLGQAFLSQVDYQLDWKHRALTLGGEVTAGARVPFEISHGRMLVTTSRGRLVLDSGADAVVLRGRTAGEIDSRLDTVTGSLDVKTAEVDIAIGKRLFRDLLAAFVPGAKQDPSEPDGLLPMSLFESIYVSNSGGYVVFGR